LCPAVRKRMVLKMKRPLYTELPELTRLVCRSGFILPDLLGAAVLSASTLVGSPFRDALAVIGSVILTIGLSLPIGLFYQLRENHGALRILGTLSRAGVEDVFESRYVERQRFFTAVGLVFRRSNKIQLLGIALSDVFSRTAPDTEEMRQSLEDTRISLQAAVLDPGCDDAIQRAETERGNTTIEDICATLKTGLPVVALTRIRSVCQQDSELQSRIENAITKTGTNYDAWSEDLLREIKVRCNLEVRVLKSLPTAYLILCDNVVFCEQYVRGRPEKFREADCIGKHVPVYQYAASSAASRFLKADFAFQWERSDDRTNEIIREAMDLGFAARGRSKSLTGLLSG
jgi:hypothetical protein